MMYTNHRNTAMVGGVALISLVPTALVAQTIPNEIPGQFIYLIYLLVLLGVFVGNKYGPDLDHPNSVARKDGALEIIVGVLLMLSAVTFVDYTAAFVMLLLFITFAVMVQAKVLNGEVRRYLTFITAMLCLGYLFMSTIQDENYINYLTFLPVLVFSYIIINKSHRKAIHSLLFCVLICGSLLATAYVIVNIAHITFISIFIFYLLFGYMFGFVFHLLMDSFSKSGVPFLYPFSKKNYGLAMYITSNVKNANIKKQKMNEKSFAILVIGICGVLTLLGFLF